MLFFHGLAGSTKIMINDQIPCVYQQCPSECRGKRGQRGQRGRTGSKGQSGQKGPRGPPVSTISML